MYFGMFDKRKKMERKIGGAQGFSPLAHQIAISTIWEENREVYATNIYSHLIQFFFNSLFFPFVPFFRLFFLILSYFFVLFIFFITFHSYPFFCVHCSSVFPFICFFFFFSILFFSHFFWIFVLSLSLSLNEGHYIFLIKI